MRARPARRNPHVSRRRRPFERRADGNYRVELDDDIRLVLGTLLEQLRDVLSTDSPAIARLFPPPYGDDEERNQGYAALAGSELVEGRLAAIDAMREQLDATELTEDELHSWMRTINDLRLVLGTLLGVTEDNERSRRRRFPDLRHLRVPRRAARDGRRSPRRLSPSPRSPRRP